MQLAASRLLLLAVPFALLQSLTNATSSGDFFICDAHSPDFGCDRHQVLPDGTENLLNCTEDTPGQMWWAKRPVRSEAYEVYVDSSSYDPNGTYLPVHVRVTQYGWKYRGLLLHAVDSTGTTVGGWGLPLSAPNYAFWHPPVCGKGFVLHTDATEKVLDATFHYRTPPPGTGTITFRTLFKKGPANEGSFHYPKSDPSLNEAVSGSPTTSTPGWFLADAGQSCTASCAKKGLACRTSDLTGRAPDSSSEHERLLGKLFPCSLRMTDSCSTGMPGASVTGDNHCWYHDRAVCPASNSSSSMVECDAVSDQVRRFCYCGSHRRSLKGRKGETKREETTKQKTRTTKSFTFTPAAADTNGASASSRPHRLALVLAALLCVGRSPSSLALLLPLSVLSLSLLTSEVEAHNWMGGPGRGKGASTTCANRRGTSVQAQLGPGQSIDFSWSTGHGQDAWILIVPGDKMHFLEEGDKFAMANDYLKQAPKGSNRAQLGAHKRWHSSSTECYGRWKDQKCDDSCSQADREKEKSDCWWVCTGRAGAAWYTQRIGGAGVTHSVPGFPRPTNAIMYEYNDEKIKNDYSVSYKSDKYPFLEAVHKYRVLAHQPNDYDRIPLQIPGLHGPGHYVVYYYWRGYTNCVDVNLHADPVPEEDIYGVPMTEPTFDKIDHCQFTNFRAITSPIYNATISAKDSMDYMTHHFPRTEYGRSGKITFQYHNGVAINVVPMKMPDDAYQPTAKMLPWRESRRSTEHETSLLRLDDSQLGPPQRSDDSTSILGRLGFTRLKFKTCVDVRDITDHAKRFWGRMPCFEIPHTECTDEDFRRIVEGVSLHLAKDAFTEKSERQYNPVPFPLIRYMHNVSTPMFTWKRDERGANHIYTCLSDKLRDGTAPAFPFVNETVVQWDWNAEGAKVVDRLSAPTVSGDTISISFQPEYMTVPNGWYRDSGRTFSQKNANGWTYSVQTEENCQGHLILTLEECQSLGATLSYDHVLHGDSLAGGNKGFSGSADAGRTIPPGCYFFSAKQSASPDEPNLVYNTYVAPENKLHWYQKCSDAYPCICKSPPNGHFQTDTADDATKTPGLEFGWNCDVSGGDTERTFDGHLAGLVLDKGTSPLTADTDNTKLRISDSCTTERTHSFGGLVRGREEGDTGYYKTWELELPEGNGEYEITILTGGFSWGCVVENFRASDFSNRGNKPVTMRRIVRDGRLTLTGHSTSCAPIAYIKIRKIGRSDLKLTPTVFPSSSNIVWEREIKDDSVLVGDVVLGGPSIPSHGFPTRAPEPGSSGYACEMGFMLDQDYCVPTNYGGTFVKSIQRGVVVSLSDEPCVGKASCPPPKHVCAHVQTPTICGIDEQKTNDREPLCPIRVWCGGIKAKYVRVELPGAHRILHVPLGGISIYRTEPNPSNVKVGDYAAYSVAVATPTKTRPEYTISTDPTDPIFYSTCYTYQVGSTFLPIVDDPPQPEWNYHGKCLDCGNYHENLNKSDATSPDAPTMKWVLSDTCQNCLATAPMLFTIDAAAKAKADADRDKAAKDAADTAAASKAIADKAIADKADADQAAKDKAAKDAADTAAASKAIADKAIADKAAADKASEEKAANKAAADKASEEKAANKAAADKASEEKAANKAAADKAAADAKAKADASGSATDIAAADAAKAKADNAAAAAKAAADAASNTAAAAKAAADAASNTAAAAKAAADTASNTAAAAKAAADVASTDRVAAKAAADDASALGGSGVNGGVIAGVVIALLVVIGLVVGLYLFRARLTSVVKKGSQGAGPVPKSPAGAAPASWQENTPTIDDPLPPGWVAAVDPGTGTTYYYDGTGKTSWTRPDARPKTEIALSPVNMQTNPNGTFF
jgi:hypothetical protein